MLYTIERDFTGYSEEQVAATGFRSLLCISFFPGMRWIRSFYDPRTQQSRCFYEAGLPGDLRHHAFSMAIPLSEVRPVVEIRRDGLGGIVVGEPSDVSDSRDPSGLPKVWAARLLTGGLSEAAVAEKFHEAARVLNGAWVRAYFDHEIEEVYAVFQAASESEIEAQVERIDLSVRESFAVAEVLPADFRELPEFSAK
jgi:hypothetical protein